MSRARTSKRRSRWRNSTFPCPGPRSTSTRDWCRGCTASSRSDTAMTISSPSAVTVRLHEVALAAVAAACEPLRATGQEADILHHTGALVFAHGRSLGDALDQAMRHPLPEDERLVGIARDLRLSPVETLAIALAASVEDDALTGRVLAHVQAPVGGSRPTVGLLISACAGTIADPGAVVPALLNGAAARTGLITILNDGAPIPERPVAVPSQMCLALAGHDSHWPGTAIGGTASAHVPLPESLRAAATRHAQALASGAGRALALRTGSPAEGRSVARAIAEGLDARPAYIETDKVNGFGPWLRLRRLVPVFCVELAPGERRKLPSLAGYDGPVLVVC